MFKRIILAAAAFSILAAPMAQAQSRHDGSRQGPRHYHAQPVKPNINKPSPFAKHHAPKRHQWRKGHRLQDWQRRAHLRDYHRYGLHRPGKGQHWVRIGNDYLLISIATGIILGMAAAR